MNSGVRLLVLLLALLGTTTTACAAPGSTLAAKPASVSLPDANVAWDYQIGGPRPVPAGAQLVVRDRSEKPAGSYPVCYVNAFQTQPQEAAYWKTPQRRDLVLRSANGKPVADSAWGEWLLDTRTADKRKRLGRVVGRWIAGCAKAGYRGVEFDNLDSWTRSGKRLTERGNLAYARLLNKIAHRHGLATAQKNTAEIAHRGKALGFDFAIVEQCGRWKECAAYADAYRGRAYVVEYSDAEWEDACRQIGSRVSVILRDRLVTPQGPYRSC